MLYYKEIEWESLHDKKIFTCGEWDFELPFDMPTIKEISIERNELYNIIVEIVCELDHKLPKEILNFEMIDLIKINGKFSSKEYLIINSKITENITSYDNMQESFKLILSPIKIVLNDKNKKEVAWIKEWYLNGPKNQIIFHRTTTYTKKEIFEKELNNTPPELREGKKFKIEKIKKGSTRRNLIFCKLNENENIMINLVPNKFGPNWSNNICLSYNSMSHITNKKLRKDLENIISFIMGRKLIKIGETHYDNSGNKITEEMINPSINQKLNIKNICNLEDNFPIPIHRYPRDELENQMSIIINSFISKKDNLDFSSMFTNYWNSTFLPPESKIILLAASLESLKNKWFESEKITNNTTIMEKPKYRRLIKNIRPQFVEQFNDCKPLIDKFDQLNNLSINKSFEKFFEKNGIEFGDLENDAISSRNDPVHGNDINTEAYCNLIIYTKIYQVIVNRVILKLLNYRGEYHISNSIKPIPIDDKIPFTLEKLRDDIYQLKYYSID